MIEKEEKTLGLGARGWGGGGAQFTFVRLVLVVRVRTLFRTPFNARCTRYNIM
jgi:hypothetical protein